MVKSCTFQRNQCHLAMKLLLKTWLAFSLFPLQAQDSLVQIPNHTYSFSRQIWDRLESGEEYLHRIAQDFSYIGEYEIALSIPNEVAFEWGLDRLTEADRTYFQEFTAVEAIPGILSRTAAERIVIINEAHHRPRHRVLTRQLLAGLYAQGYRYFGLETLTNCVQVPDSLYCDPLLNDRKYALNSPRTGTYIKEPQMGNLIREGLQLGFELFAYEHFGEGRERKQAEHIARILARDPEAKIVIHCGWYHLLEEENRGKRWMASYLKEITGIDPFTIYQDILVEKPTVGNSPFYDMMTFAESSVFINAKGKFYNGFSDNPYFDVLVYHPPNQYIQNRPTWLWQLKGLQAVEISPREIDYPCLIKAYLATEGQDAVPVDIIEKKNARDPKVLLLPEGTYQIVIENPDGEQEVSEIEVIGL